MPRSGTQPGRRRGRSTRLRLAVGHGPLLPDPTDRPARARDARGLHHAGVHRRDRPNASSSAPWSPACTIAIPASWPRSSPRSTCCLAGAPGSASAPAGTPTKAAAWACRFRRSKSASSAWTRRSRSVCRCGAATSSRFVASTTISARPLNSPQSLSRPHPRIVIGGGGEQKTLRLVARYGDACNLFPTPEIPHKLEVLRAHCDAEGRDYAAIEKTSMYMWDPRRRRRQRRASDSGLALAGQHGHPEHVHLRLQRLRPQTAGGHRRTHHARGRRPLSCVPLRSTGSGEPCGPPAASRCSRASRVRAPSRGDPRLGTSWRVADPAYWPAACGDVANATSRALPTRAHA